MRYSFELCGDELPAGQSAQDVADFDEAVSTAMVVAGQLLCDRSQEAHGGMDWCLDVRDHRGRIVYRLEVRSVEAQPVERMAELLPHR